MEIKLEAGHGGDLKNGLCLIRNPVQPQQHRVTHSFWNGHVLAGDQLHSGITLLQSAGSVKGVRKLLHEKRNAQRLVVNRCCERRAQRLAQDSGGQGGSIFKVERLN